MSLPLKTAKIDPAEELAIRSLFEEDRLREEKKPLTAGHREVTSYKNLHAYWDTNHPKWRIYGVYDASTDHNDDVGRILFEKDTLSWVVEGYPNSPSDDVRQRVTTFSAADDRDGVKRALMALEGFVNRLNRTAESQPLHTGKAALPHGWKKLPTTGSYIIYENATGLVRVQDTRREGHALRYQVLYKPATETLVLDGKLVERSQGGGKWLEVDEKSSLAAALALGVRTEANMKNSKTAKSNAKVVEVPNTFHQVELQEPKATRKEFPFEGFIDFQGIKIDVENAKGSTRSGTGPDGDWSTYMNAHYGEIRGTEGTDGDKLDVYVGDNHDASLVVVVHQHNPWDGQYDEDKVVLGCESIEEAIGLYKKQYDRPGFYREGEYTAMPIGAFWRWVNEERNKGKRVKAARKASFQMSDTPVLQIANHKGWALLQSGGSIKTLTDALNMHMVRRVPPAQQVHKVAGAVKAFSFHWSNAQAKWDAIAVRDFPWGIDGAEFVLFLGRNALSPVGKPWSLNEMHYIAKGLNHHPGFAVSVKAAADDVIAALTKQAVVTITMGEVTNRLKRDRWRADRYDPSWEMRLAEFYSVRINQRRHTGTKKELYQVVWYTGNPAHRWSSKTMDTLKEAVVLANQVKAESDRISAEELGESPEGKLARVRLRPHDMLTVEKAPHAWMEGDWTVQTVDRDGSAVVKNSRGTSMDLYPPGTMDDYRDDTSWYAVGPEYDGGTGSTSDSGPVTVRMRSSHQAAVALKWVAVSRLDAATLKDALWVKWVRITSSGQAGQVVARRMPNGWHVQLLKADESFNLKAPIKGRPKTDADILKAAQDAISGLMVVKGVVAPEAPKATRAPETPKAPAAPVFTPEQLRERDLVSKRTKGVNPFVYNPWGKPANGFQIGFTVPRLQEPLWWTGSGFKNLSSSRAEPEMFKTEAEADHKVRAELLLFIKKWRDDDAHLVLGWDKPTAPRVMNTPAVKAPEPTPDSFTADEVTSFLRSMSTRRGGRNRNVEFRDSRDSWFAEPDYRERLDHYVGSHYNPGPDDDPEGWDSEGWEEEYAGPLRKEVQDKLDARFGKGFLSVDIGEKGHIYVYLETKGRALLKTGAVPKDPATTVLGNLLAHLRALGWNHLTSHWQVSGDSFYGDHLLFERLYGKVVEETDGLAEKLVGLFGTEAVNGAEQAKLMAFALHQASETACPYQRALRMEQAFQVMLEKSLDVMDHLGVLSLGLDDMLRTMANDHETHLYLLQQRLSGVKVASAQGASSDPRGRLAAKYVLRRLAALAGTDTASFYVIAPEQLATIIRDGGWADMAHHLWGLHDGDVATLVPDMENVIRQHGGAVLNTGADGIWDVKAFDLEGDVAAPLSANHHVEELGYLPPYGTPEYQASKK